MTESLSNEELIKLDAQLHGFFGKETFGYSEKELIRWHEIVVDEMGKRGLKHNVLDELTMKSIKRDPIWKNYSFPEEIVVEKNVVRLIGDTVTSFEEPESTDLLLSRLDLEDTITGTLAGFGPAIDCIIDTQGVVRGPNVPIYNLVLKRVDTLEVVYPEKECWTKAPWIASKGEKKIELEMTTDLTTTEGLHKLSDSLDIGSWDVIRGNILYVVDRASDHLVVQYPDGSYKQVLLEKNLYLEQPRRSQQYVLERYKEGYSILKLSVGASEDISWTIQSETPFAIAEATSRMDAHTAETNYSEEIGKVLIGKQLPDFHEYYLSGQGRILFGKVNGTWHYSKPKDQTPWYYQKIQEGDFSQIGSRDEFIADKIAKTFKIPQPSGEFPHQQYLLGAKSSIKFIKKGEVLLINGIAIAEGVWRGLDLKTIRYPYNVLVDAAPSLLQVQLKLHHKGRDIDVKGFVSRVWTDPANKTVWVKLMVFDQATIALLLTSADEFGLSVEGYAIKLDRSKTPYNAQQLIFTAIALTDDPACKVCRIDPSTMEVMKLE